MAKRVHWIAGLSVYAVHERALHNGKIVLFEKQGLSGSQGVEDLWFPSDFLNYGEELDFAAKRVLKAWGKVESAKMKLVKVFSIIPLKEDWHLTFLYVVELKNPAKIGEEVKAIKVIEKTQQPHTVG